MATSLNSRFQFLNLKQIKLKKQSSQQNYNQNTNNQALKLILPQMNYQPTNPNNNTRTTLRMLKGKFQKNTDNQIKIIHQNNSFRGPFANIQSNILEQPRGEIRNQNFQFTNKISSQQNLKKFKQQVQKFEETELKLILPQQVDSNKQKQKKLIANKSHSKQGFSKKILIQKQNKTEQKNIRKEIQQVILESQPFKSQFKQNISEIKEQQKQEEQSKQLQKNENQLIECPEGCGRKFNRIALQTHSKACKIVFMSKRKQFNSQAKRVTSKEQANLVKQAKLKQKKQYQATKLQANGAAWKTKSEGFRAVVKALKQQQIKIQQLKLMTCQYCEKTFNEVIYNKHLIICEVKLQRQKEKQKKIKKQHKKILK